ncbi:GNAT family N-acetyltransferase [Calothrix sp. UHCC 0171]|uniref:GNAT family N-acetyltransferase n=1 Tax=Calothrix sp. UHCC 0171 TaxID=3110245 RepID=UPI002B2212FF|nr:GNAT family N-acetyltransferase [Calothrix sp. UHCC 0171]MEA5571373.1 GNAT family N-acetyltransferase [Calothrix sp. UHCC 0171]
MKPWFFHPSQQQPHTSANSGASCRFEVRAATSADLQSISQIIADSFHSSKGFWGWAFPLLRLGIYEDLRHRLTSPAPHHLCLVAVDTSSTSDNLAGTVELGVRFNDSWAKTAKSFPYLSNLAVHPNYRRQGAASELLAGCEKLAQEWGFQDVYLHVLENNYQARQLYFKHGYRVHQVESNLNTLIFRRDRQILLHKHLIAEAIT